MIIPLPALQILVALLYLWGAFSRWRASQKSTAELAHQTLSPLLPLVWVFAGLTLVLHGTVLVMSIAAPDGIDISVGNAASLVAFLCVAVAWASGLMRALSGFSSILLIFSAAAVILPVLFPGEYRFAYGTQTGMAMHIAVAFSAYALFFVAALLALTMVSMEKRIRSGKSSEKVRRTLPLLTLERYLFRLIFLGFVLLSLTVLSGIFFSEQIFGEPFHLNHKTALSIISWFIFGTLLFGRWRFGWRGKRAFYWILTGTAALMLAYLGYKFVVEVIIH
jgi:ABC-type uncharacterized transport system permease subunit